MAPLLRAAIDRRFRSFLLIPLTLMLVVLAACSGSDGAPDSVATDDLPLAVLQTRWATDSADNLTTLLESSGWAFTAEVVRLDHQAAVDLVPDVPGATPAPTVLGKPLPANDGPPPLPVSIWEVRVIDVMAGDVAIGDTVLIQQMGGVHQQSDGSHVRVVFDGDELLVPGEEFLFFTAPSTDGDPVMTSPFTRLRVGSDGSLTPLPEWASLGAMQALTSLKSAQAASAIEAARQ